jgi:serine/threonine-protein kinase HipA
MSLSLGRSAGFEVPDFSLVAMPDEMPPALIVERFDIRTSEHDNRRMAMEDFCSLLDLPPEDKYKGTIEQAGRALRGISTRPNDDLLLLLKRAVFAWLIADGDMHLKNMAVLKTAMPDDIVFRSVRMAPLYDAVTTVVFPNLEHDRMALKLNGKDSRLKLADFTKAAVTMGISAAAVESEVAQMLKQLRTSLDLQLLPAPISNDEMNAMIVRMKDISMQRINKLGQEMVG